jgi:hypothetical protein
VPLAERARRRNDAIQLVEIAYDGGHHVHQLLSLLPHVTAEEPAEGGVELEET